jgi:hypothetical protein
MATLYTYLEVGKMHMILTQGVLREREKIKPLKIGREQSRIICIKKFG